MSCSIDLRNVFLSLSNSSQGDTNQQFPLNVKAEVQCTCWWGLCSKGVPSAFTYFI